MHDRFDRDDPSFRHRLQRWQPDADDGDASFEDDYPYVISGDGESAPSPASHVPADELPAWYHRAYHTPEDYQAPRENRVRNLAPQPRNPVYPFSVEGQPHHTRSNEPVDPPAPLPAPAPPAHPADRGAWPARPRPPRNAADVPVWQPLSQALAAPVPTAIPPAIRRPLYPPPVVREPKKAFTDTLELLRRGKWWMLFIFLLVAGGIGYYSFTIPPEYEAHSLLMLDTREAPDLRSAFEPDDGPSFVTRKLSNQAIILGQSLILAERTADRLLELQHVPETGEPIEILRATPPAPVTRDALAKRLQEEFVTVEPASQDMDADALRIRAISSRPAEAALIANLFAEEYVRHARESGRQHVTASRTFLEEQLERRREELRLLEEQVEQYMNEEGAVSPGDEAQRTMGQIDQLQGSLDAALIDERMHEASLRSIENELAQLHPRMAQRVASGAEQEIAQAQARITELELRLEPIYQKNPELRTSPGSNADVQQLNSQIQQLRTRVRDLSEQYVDEVFAVGGVDVRSQEGGMGYLTQLKRQLAETRVAYSGAQARASALRQRLGEYRGRLKSLPTQSMTLSQLQRSRQSAERLYLSLVEQVQTARIKEESGAASAQIIRPATTPDEPTSPNRTVNVALGILLGLLLGFGAAVLRQKLDTRIYTPADLRDRGQTLIGVVPDMRPFIRQTFGKKKSVFLDWREVSTSLGSLLSPLSPIAEAYRRIYADLAYSEAAPEAQTVLVTSPEMGTGKSVTALNLAITAAQAGRRTLIIDADLHRPALHGYLGYMPDPELTRILIDRTAQMSIENLATGVHNLYALSLRDLAAVPAELLGSRRLYEFVERLRGVFDLIIFDSPPALVATDASLLAALCDQTLVVVSSAHTQAEDLEETLETLRKLGARIAGTVLNRFDPARTYGYRRAYKYRDRYYRA